MPNAKNDHIVYYIRVVKRMPKCLVTIVICGMNNTSKDNCPNSVNILLLEMTHPQTYTLILS